MPELRSALIACLPAGLLAGALLCGGCGPSSSVPDREPAGLVFVAGGTPADPQIEGSRARPGFHDFGEVPQGSVLEHAFEFVNTESLPVTVQRASASCSCTIPLVEAITLDGQRIEGDTSDPNGLIQVPPGATLRVVLRIDTAVVHEANRDKLVTVRMVTDAPKSAFISLEAHLIAVRDLTAVPDVADLGSAPASIGGTMDVSIGRAGPARLTPVEVLEAPEGWVVSLGADPRSLDHWVMTTTLSPGHDEGFAGGLVRLSTQDDAGDAGPPFEFPVRALVVPDIQVSPPNVALRAFEGGLQHEVRIVSHLPGHHFRVDAVEVLPLDLVDVEVEAVPVRPTASGSASAWDLRVRVASPRPGIEYEGRLLAQLDDAQYPSIEIPFVTVSRP
ncbi:DUF1573 domain-containing protein [Engelhardtia mirabilis]|uniref:DUF1573 domain-containing protein n=1 Tax=Engelhardtia mirabilis TaxID=2528011 RepID=UPI003AF3D0CB